MAREFQFCHRNLLALVLAAAGSGMGLAGLALATALAMGHFAVTGLPSASAAAATAAPTVEEFDHCVVGAGPGGLQLGHLLHTHNRSFAIFEAGPVAGSFFDRYPRHRTLISLNKKHTGRSSREYRLRHDWNSLLDHDDVPRMADRTTERFPNADLLAEYLREFAAGMVSAGRIRFNTEVAKIDRRGGPDGGFAIAVVGPAGDAAIGCATIVVATGIGVPRIPPISGIEHATGYDTVPTDARAWKGKTIGILGAGNAALEVANNAANHANYVHVFGLRPAIIWPRFSWETRYSGGVRGTHVAHLDGYLLKSNDLITDTGIQPAELRIARCDEPGCNVTDLNPFDSVNGSLLLFKSYNDSTGVPHLQLGEIDADGLDDRLAEFETLLGVGPEAWQLTELDPREFVAAQVTRTTNTDARSRTVRRAALKGLAIRADYSPGRVSRLHRIRRLLANPDFTDVYDEVVYATGWLHNRTIYGTGAEPMLQASRRLPRLAPGYESENVPGMFFAGALAHADDFRRGSGGFIGGFRYAARALFRHLDETYHSAPWPHRTFDLSAGVNELADALLGRINEGSGPYQMVYSIGDSVELVRRGGAKGEWQAVLREEHPLALANRIDGPRLYWHFGFEFGQASSLEQSMLDGTGFRPVVIFWPDASGQSMDSASRWSNSGWTDEESAEDGGVGVRAPVRKELFRLSESYNGDWGGAPIREALVGWLSSLISMLSADHTEKQTASTRRTKRRSDSVPHPVWEQGDFDFGHRNTEATAGSFELDVVFVNTLRVPVTIEPPESPQLMRTKRGAVAIPPGGKSPRMVAYDGELWAAAATEDKGTLLGRRWRAAFEAGIYQEVRIEDGVLRRVGADFGVRSKKKSEPDEDEHAGRDCSAETWTVERRHLLEDCRKLASVVLRCPKDEFSHDVIESFTSLQHVVGAVDLLATDGCRLGVDAPLLKRAGSIRVEAASDSAVDTLTLPELSTVSGAISIRSAGTTAAHGPGQIGYVAIADTGLALATGPISVEGGGNVDTVLIGAVRYIGQDASGASVQVHGALTLGLLSINFRKTADYISEASLRIQGDVVVEALGCAVIDGLEVLGVDVVEGEVRLQADGAARISPVKFGGALRRHPILAGGVNLRDTSAHTASAGIGLYGRHAGLRERTILFPALTGAGADDPNGVCTAP